ncbi:ABC transporter substrate-binding protein [Microvirga tunisiensis]|uniref:ABC transporter substrate-binding protein n=2 Tax=Microvirga tunisiensis TaxID=2108360 RepID=A0A5N7MR90_9HYPH|nr:ABC transporter substrate-binding protein [Microvirga tunisiensis]MPR29368.1 ABC transporter substrate-binding protein [Microvirga tunisiensis]
MLLRLLGAVLGCFDLLVGLQAGFAAEVTRFPAPGGEHSVITIHAATDLAAMKPLIQDFQVLMPTVSIEYNEYVTNDLFAAAQKACAAGESPMDVILSSSVDQLVALVNRGCALTFRSPQTAQLPSWAKWRDEVFGFTIEPAVIVYNKALVPPEDIPRTRGELLDLLRAKPERYDGKIGSYDITQSGIGYLFASYDARTSSTYGRLLEAFGRAHAVTHCCTSDVLADLAAGRIALGYNLLGSYAYGALKAGAPIGIVIPRDYNLVLIRAVLIPVGRHRPAAAQRFVDYLLSERGQRVGREASFFFGAETPLPPEVDGPMTLSMGGTFNPVTIGPELLVVQDRARRARFLEEWRRSMRGADGQ